MKEVDIEPGTHDPEIDADHTSDTASTTSSNYVHRYGKRRSLKKTKNLPRFWLTLRYHGISDNPYPLPNDELEKDRLNALQTCFHLLLGTNIVVPLEENPTQISRTLLIVKAKQQSMLEPALGNGSLKSLMNIQLRELLESIFPQFSLQMLPQMLNSL